MPILRDGPCSFETFDAHDDVVELSADLGLIAMERRDMALDRGKAGFDVAQIIIHVRLVAADGEKLLQHDAVNLVAQEVRAYTKKVEKPKRFPVRSFSQARTAFGRCDHNAREIPRRACERAVSPNGSIEL